MLDTSGLFMCCFLVVRHFVSQSVNSKRGQLFQGQLASLSWPNPQAAGEFLKTSPALDASEFRDFMGAGDFIRLTRDSRLVGLLEVQRGRLVNGLPSTAEGPSIRLDSRCRIPRGQKWGYQSPENSPGDQADIHYFSNRVRWGFA